MKLVDDHSSSSNPNPFPDLAVKGSCSILAPASTLTLFPTSKGCCTSLKAGILLLRVSGVARMGTAFFCVLVPRQESCLSDGTEMVSSSRAVFAQHGCFLVSSAMCHCGCGLWAAWRIWARADDIFEGSEGGLPHPRRLRVGRDAAFRQRARVQRRGVYGVPGEYVIFVVIILIVVVFPASHGRSCRVGFPKSLGRL